MTRKIEVFVSGCSLCDEAVALVRSVACPSCEIEVRKMEDEATRADAKGLGIGRVPAIVIDGVLLDCCQGGIDHAMLGAAGVGSPVA